MTRVTDREAVPIAQIRGNNRRGETSGLRELRKFAIQIANKPGTYTLSIINGHSNNPAAGTRDIPPGTALTVTVP
jgi:hypothetical protein